MTSTPIIFPNPDELQEHVIDLGNGETITYVWNGLTWVRKDSKVLNDLGDVNVDLTDIPAEKYQYLIYNPQGEGTWTNSVIKSDGFLVYKGLIDVSIEAPIEEPVSGHLYIHTFADGVIPDEAVPLEDEWVGIQSYVLQGGEKIIFNGNVWEVFADFEGSLLPDSLLVSNEENDGEEGHEYGWLSYESDIPNRSGRHTLMPMSDAGLQTYPSVASWVEVSDDVTEDSIASWNENLKIDLDGVLDNGKETFQRIKIGKDIRFRPSNDEGKVIGRTLAAVLGDGTFRWNSKQLGNPSNEYTTVGYVNGNYILASSSTEGKPAEISFSFDRHSWIESDTTTLGNVDVYAFSYSSMKKIYLAGSQGGHIYYSSDKLTWQESGASDYFDGDDVYSIDYANDKFIAVGANGKAASSSDGINWTEITGLTSSNSNTLYGVVHSESEVWMAVGVGIGVISIDHGVTWTNSLSTSQTLRCISYSTPNRQWGVGGDNSSVWLSDKMGDDQELPTPNTGQWTEHQNIISGKIQDIEYVNGYWIVVGDEINYKLDTSATWFTPSTTNVIGTSYSIATDGNVLCLAHSNGYIVNGYLFNGGLFYDGDLLVTEALLQDITSQASLQSLVDTDVDGVEDGQTLVYRAGFWRGVPLAEVPEVIQFQDFIDTSTADPIQPITAGTLYIQHSEIGGPVTVKDSWVGLAGGVVSEGEYVVYSGADEEWHRSGGSAASQIKSDWDEISADAASYIYNKPEDLIEFKNSSANPYVQISNLTLDKVVSNTHMSAVDPNITDTNIRVGEKLMLGSDENYLFAEDNKLLYKEDRVITDKDIAIAPVGGALGEAGIVIPGNGINYNSLTGQMDVVIESLITFRGVIISNDQSPEGDDVSGDFYLVGENTTSLGLPWGFDEMDPKPVSPNDKVILDRDGTNWIIIPDPLGSLAVLEVKSATDALGVDLTDVQYPVLTIDDATQEISGLLSGPDKIVLDSIQASGQLISGITVEENSPIQIESTPTGIEEFPINTVELSISPTSQSLNGYGVTRTLDATEVIGLVKTRAEGTEASLTTDTYMEASDAVNSFLTYNFSDLPAVTEVAEV